MGYVAGVHPGIELKRLLERPAREQRGDESRPEHVAAAGGISACGGRAVGWVWCNAARADRRLLSDRPTGRRSDEIRRSPSPERDEQRVTALRQRGGGEIGRASRRESG